MKQYQLSLINKNEQESLHCCSLIKHIINRMLVNQVYYGHITNMGWLIKGVWLSPAAADRIDLIPNLKLNFHLCRRIEGNVTIAQKLHAIKF